MDMKSSYLICDLAISIGVLIPLMAGIGLMVGKKMKPSTFFVGFFINCALRILYNLVTNYIFYTNLQEYSMYINAIVSITIALLGLNIFSKKYKKTPEIQAHSYGYGYGCGESLFSVGMILFFNRIALSTIINNSIYDILSSEYDEQYIQDYINSYLSIEPISYIYSAIFAVAIVMISVLAYMIFKKYLQDKNKTCLLVSVLAYIVLYVSSALVNTTGYYVTIAIFAVELILLFIFYRKVGGEK